MKKRNPKVLVINNTPSEIAPLYDLLLDSCDVIFADDGETGLNIANETDIDLVLMDPIMSDTSCLELYENFATSPKTSHIPLIFVVGSLPVQQQRILNLNYN